MTLTRWLNIKGKWWVETVCECGKVSKNKRSDVIAKIGTDFCCKSCTMKARNKDLMQDPEYVIGLMDRLKLATAAGAPAMPEKVKSIRRTLVGATQRCTNEKCGGYKNYGGRGIEFKFTSIEAASDWIVENIGYRPTKAHTLDRIDNDGNYEAGNLRWATRTEQCVNRRAFKLGAVGTRIRKLQELRPDLCYEALRYQIKIGLNDEQIIRKEKHRHSTSV